MSLNIYNTLKGNKEPFHPLEEGKIKMYVCGVTVYDYCHLGHARCYVSFDVVQRHLRFLGYELVYVRNFTDVDDKIINRANEGNEPPQELADRFIGEFHTDMKSLGVQVADIEPKVSTHIQEIIALVQRLEANDHAYAVDGDVYFDVQSFAPYGALSKRNLEDMQAGARVEVDTRKRNPADFALWKSVKPGEPFWESPWGDGRPGWHIECSAMSCTHLGEEFDIHGGGMDLVFPHHENEIAQSQGASGKVPVRYWMHNGFVNVDKEKMSKSLGNFFTIRDVLERYHAQSIRLFLLTTHYRSPINYSLDNLESTTARITYIYDTLKAVNEALVDDIDTESGPLIEETLVEGVIDQFTEAMNDDFNTPRAIGHLSDLIKLANNVVRSKRKTPGRGRTLKAIQSNLAKVSSVLGIMGEDPLSTLAELRALAIFRMGINELEVDQLIASRSEARSNKDWSLADEYRDQLAALGIEVMDSREGTSWRPVVQVVEEIN
jgi:cysteinyl-tRNA synthetase